MPRTSAKTAKTKNTTKKNEEFVITEDMIFDRFICHGDQIVVLDAKKVYPDSEFELLFTKAILDKNGNIALTELTDDEIETAMQSKKKLEKIFGGKNE